MLAFLHDFDNLPGGGMIARQAFLKPFYCGIELAGEIKDCAE